MFPFISDHVKQTAAYHAFKAEERRKKYECTPEEREALEEGFKAEYGEDYIEDKPASPKEIRDCINRLKSKHETDNI